MRPGLAGLESWHFQVVAGYGPKGLDPGDSIGLLVPFKGD